MTHGRRAYAHFCAFLMLPRRGGESECGGEEGMGDGDEKMGEGEGGGRKGSVATWHHLAQKNFFLGESI